MSSEPAAPAPPPSTVVGALFAERYRVLRRIGRGGMGEVYEAEHVHLGKRVAIKILIDKYRHDADAIARFRREAMTASQIGDPHIVDVVDIGTASDGRTFVVMELLAGGDLSATMAAVGPMPVPRVLAIIGQVLRGLAAAHAKGVVHRDMKPENVFLVIRDGAPEVVKIVDFGISKITGAPDEHLRLTATGAVIGTPIYMAPEQALGNPVDGRADLYAVGVMMFEMLAGRPPFSAPSYLALVTQHLHKPPPDLGAIRSDLPRALIQVIERALAKEPAQRSADARAMLAELEGLSAVADQARTWNGDSASARQVPAVDARAATARAGDGRGRRILPVVAALAVLAGGAALWILRRGGATPPGPAASRAAADPRHGSLEIRSAPDGAEVSVDGRIRGLTPITVVDLDPGRHQLRVSSPGMAVYESVLDVAGGTHNSLFIPMVESGAGTGSATGTGTGTGSATGTGTGSATGTGSRRSASSTERRVGTSVPAPVGVPTREPVVAPAASSIDAGVPLPRVDAAVQQVPPPHPVDGAKPNPF